MIARLLVVLATLGAAAVVVGSVLAWALPGGLISVGLLAIATAVVLYDPNGADG